jgi:hypothetical protein
VGDEICPVDVVKLPHEIIIRVKAAVRDTLCQVAKDTRLRIPISRHPTAPLQIVTDQLSTARVDFLIKSGFRAS